MATKEKPPSPEWEAIEEKVNEAEEAKRQANVASRGLFAETGLTKSERGSNEGLVPKEAVRNPRVFLKATEREESLEAIAEDILGEEGSAESELVRLRQKNLITALRYERDLDDNRAGLLAEEAEILKGIHGVPAGPEQDALGDIRKELEGVERNREELLASSPEAYIGLHLKELKSYKKDLEKGRIAETPYVKRQAEDITAHLRAGKPVLIYGHLGSGKTELAMHIAREYIGTEALVISGSKNMSLAELYGHQVLALDKLNGEEVDVYAREVGRKYEEWVAENRTKIETLSSEEREAEKNRAHDRILEIYLTKFKSGTVSDFFLGPIYRAMQEGRPVIIDEVNAIPHEVLISLNHILTRKVGEKINVQQNSGSMVEVREGFGIMMTGNLNQGQERYVDRQDMDPAFLSRLYKIEHDYLPQLVEGSLADEAGSENELFHLLLARSMDRTGNIEAPDSTPSKLWNLAKAAKVTEEVFAGKEVNRAFYFQEAGGRPTRYLLKEAVLSLRGMDNVISQWQKDGYKYEIDYYLWKEFVSQSTVASDKAYLYQLFKDRFGFFASEGWPQSPDYGTGGMVDAFDVIPPKNPSGDMAFFGPRKVVEMAYGAKPARAEWPDSELSAEKTPRDEAQEFVKELALREDKVKALRDRIALLKNYATKGKSATPDSAKPSTPPKPKKKRFGIL